MLASVRSVGVFLVAREAVPEGGELSAVLRELSAVLAAVLRELAAVLAAVLAAEPAREASRGAG